MKKILQLVGVCCFSMALMSGDVCGVQETKESRELLNPSVMQTALSGLVQEIEKDLRGDSTLRKNVESKVKSFAKKHNLALGIDCFSASGLDVVNELVRATFRATRELMDKSEPSEKMTSILADTCYFLSRELIALDHRSELHPDMFTEILEFSWGNPKLMKIAELVMIDAENGVSDHSMITSAPNTGFELAKRLRNLIFKNPNKYDAAIRGWIEENRSKDWHWKWKSFVELPAFNKPEVIKSLIPLLKRGRNDFRGIDMGTANNVTSLVEFLNFGNCGFGYWWQSFLNSPEYFTELLKSSWGNPELMENTRSLIADAKRGVSNHGEVFDQGGDDEF
ncbi:MAG: hypothetical protein LBJ71_03935 [Holosporaceae bacterium]|nr:hypothetical protein [Holosporaceae bacterium]